MMMTQKYPKKQSQIWRLFSQNSFKVDDLIALDDTEHHYTFNVLRLEPGALVELSSASGQLSQATLESISKKGTNCRILKVTDNPTPVAPIDLIVGMPKPGALEETLQIAAEMGARNLIFFKSDHSHFKGTEKSEKWAKIAQESLRISKATLPLKIMTAQSLDEAIALSHGTTLGSHQLAVNNLLFACDELFQTNDTPVNIGFAITKQLAKLSSESDFSKVLIQIVIGPEASFSDNERQKLNSKGAHTVSLGPLILRVPTAVSYALSVTLDCWRCVTSKDM